MNTKKTIAISILLLIFIFLILLKTLNFETFYVNNNHQELDKVPFIIILSFIVTLLLILIFEKRIDFWTYFNFSWVFIIVSILNLWFIDYYDYRAFDYYTSKKIKNYNSKNYVDEFGLTISDFFLKNDTITLSQNPSFGKIYVGKFKIYKSRFHNYYYIQEDE